MPVIIGIDLNSSEQKICLKYKSEFSLTLAIKKKKLMIVFSITKFQKDLYYINM